MHGNKYFFLFKTRILLLIIFSFIQENIVTLKDSIKFHVKGNRKSRFYNKLMLELKQTEGICSIKSIKI